MQLDGSITTFSMAFSKLGEYQGSCGIATDGKSLVLHEKENHGRPSTTSIENDRCWTYFWGPLLNRLAFKRGIRWHLATFGDDGKNTSQVRGGKKAILEYQLHGVAGLGIAL